MPTKPLIDWWARQDSNLQPDRYERPSLPIELQAPPVLPLSRTGNGAGDPLQCGWRSCNAGAVFQSTDTPANSTTLRHFSVSSAISLPNSAGVIGFGMPPMAVSFSTSFGSFSASPTALLRMSTISGGVPLGAEIAQMRTDSNPGTVSAIAGMSGRPGQRCGEVTPSARTVPARDCSSADGKLSKISCTLLEMMSGKAIADPR